MIYKISLSKNNFALVDKENFSSISKFKWHFASGRAARKVTINGESHNQFMHRLIMDAPIEMEVDHINGNSLDNRRSNLRLASRRQNMANIHAQKKNILGLKGVRFKKDHNKYISYIKVNYKQKFLGYFDDPITAAKAYNEAAKEYFGEFSRLNVI